MIFICSFFFIFIINHHADAAEAIFVSIDDEFIEWRESPLIVKENIIYAPLQKVTKLLNGTAYVSSDYQEITVILGENTLYVNKSKNLYSLNNEILYDNQIQIFNNNAYISLSYITSINHYSYKKITNYPLIRINTSDKLLPLEQYLDKMKPYMTSNTKPTVYLTFDDGPNQYTDQNIATLQRYNVKATFFFVGNYLSNQRLLVQKVNQAGHYIGLHSMTHNIKKLYTSTNSFIQEMKTENVLLTSYIGQSSVLIRTPYGSKPWVTPTMHEEIVKNKWKLWDWDIDPKDWQYNKQEYKQIIENVKQGIKLAETRKDQHIVVLLHDRVGTAIALPFILEWLTAEGYNIAPYNPESHIIQNFLNDAAL